MSTMSSEKCDAFLVRFNGKNYSTWSFHFQIFVTWKDLWGHIDGSTPVATLDKDKNKTEQVPTLDKDRNKTEQAKWEVKYAQIMAWIISSVESNIVLNLRPFKTAIHMWEHLKRLYSQNNIARRFQLEHELASLHFTLAS